MKLANIVAKYKTNLDKGHRDACLELNNRIFASTPVDTGFARNKWTPKGNLVIGDTYAYLNNTKYIIPLEYGHSDQARNPNGMLRINVRNWASIVRSKM